MKSNRLQGFALIFSVLVVIFFSTNCTTIGFHQNNIRESMDFGEYHEFRVCTFHEPDITEKEIEDLFLYWNEELKLYNLKANPVRITKVKRPGFTGFDIMNYLYNQPMHQGCDRLLYLKGRKFVDIAYEVLSLGVLVGLGFKVEMQGAVDSKTHSRGYIKAKYISTFQLIFDSPKGTLVHEGYHLLGCGHQLLMKDCYKQIESLKKLNLHPEKEENFFPSLTSTGKKFIDRYQVNQGVQ